MQRDIVDKCTLEREVGESDNAYSQRCNIKAMDECALTRNSDESAVVYMVRCKAASLVFDNTVEEVFEVIEVDLEANPGEDW